MKKAEQFIDLGNGAVALGDGGPSAMESLWPRLTLDEKRYLTVRLLLTTDIEAASYIGRDKAWLDRTKRKDTFKRAFEARQGCGDDEVKRLLDYDLQMLLKADLAGWVQSGKMAKKDLLSVTHLMAQAVKKDKDVSSKVQEPKSWIYPSELAPLPSFDATPWDERGDG